MERGAGLRNPPGQPGIVKGARPERGGGAWRPITVGAAPSRRGRCSRSRCSVTVRRCSSAARGATQHGRSRRPRAGSSRSSASSRRPGRVAGGPRGAGRERRDQPDAGVHAVRPNRGRPAPRDRVDVRRWSGAVHAADPRGTPARARAGDVLRSRNPRAVLQRLDHEIAADGDVIGDHTEVHAAMSKLSAAKQRAQLLEQASAIERYGASFPRLFRPPYGLWNATTLSLLRPLPDADGAVDRRHERLPAAGRPRDRRPAVDGAQPGAIILLHDAGGDRSQTVAALPKIIAALRRRHYELVTVPRLLLDNPAPRVQDIAAGDRVGG